MRIRKNQHLITHAAAIMLTGGASAPIDAAMVGTKAVRNHRADQEMEHYFGHTETSAPSPSTYDRNQAKRAYADSPEGQRVLQANARNRARKAEKRAKRNR